MSDPVLISQIITSLGLSGQEAENKRQELEKLTNDELNKLIANISSYSPAELGGFSALSLQEKFSGNVFKPAIIDDLQIAFPSSASSSSAYTKEYSSLQRKQLDRFLGDFLFNSASSGYQELKAYNDSVGWFNITDRVVNGFKVLSGQQDRIGLQQQMSEEMQAAKKLKDAAYSQPAAFESQFERKYGVPYSHANVENLKQASENYTRVTAYHEKTQLLKDGFKEVKKILQQEQEYSQARKYVRGAAAASLQPPEVPSHEKFGEILLQFCNGDQNLVNEYMKNLSAKMGSKSEIEKNLPKIMEELIQKAEAEEKEALGNKTYSQYQQEYETACKKVFGTKDYKETAKNFVENAKTQSAYTEIGITIAASMLLPSSSIARKGIQKAALKYGEKASMNMMKGAMTVTTGPLPAALTTLNAATSEAGFTPEAIAQIKEKFKSGMLYGGYGAFVSSPLGLAVEKVLSKNPTMLSNIVSKTMGAATETSADVLLDRMTSDLSFIDSLKQNGIMNFGMMIAGGQVNRALSKLTVSKTDNGYTVKDETGKEVFNAEDENALAGFVMAKAAENTAPSDAAAVKSDNAAEANPFQTKNTAQTSDPVLPKAAELPFSELKAQVEEKINNIPGLKEKLRDTILTEENIVVLNKILSDEKLYTNPIVMLYSKKLLVNIKTPEQQQIALKLLSDEKLYTNPIVMLYSKNLLVNIKTPEQQQIALKLLSDERIYNNTKIMDASGFIIQSCTDAQSLKAKSDVIDILLSDDKYLTEPQLQRNAGHIIRYSTNPQQAAILNKILSNETLLQNASFIPDLMLNCQNPDIAKSILNILSNKSFSDSNVFAKGFISAGIKTNIPARALIAEKILTDEKLYNNPSVINSLTRILSTTGDMQNAQAKIDVINFILSDEKCSNIAENIKNNLFSGLMYSASNSNQVSMLKKLLSDERLHNNPAFLNEIPNIIYLSKSPEGAAAKMTLFDKVMSDEKLYTNTELMNQFGRVLSDLKTDTLPSKIWIIDKFLSDDKLYNNTYVKNDLFLLLRYANTPEQLRLAETILSDEKLFNNQSIMSWLPSILGYSDTPQKAQIAQMILSDEKLYNNPAVTKDISILLNCTESGNILIVKEALADIASAQPKRSTENNIQMIMDSHYTAMETVADWEQYRRVIQEALSKKDQLKAANQDLSNQDIENFFESNRQTVSYALKMLGEDTFTAAFNLKLEGLKELCDKCEDIKYYLSAEDYKALTEKIAPPSQARIKQLQDEITALKKQFPAAKASGDPQAFNDLKNKINTKTKELRDYQNSGAKLDPQTKINKLRVIASLSSSDDISKFIDLIQTPTKESEQAWNKAIEEKVFESLGFEYDKQLADKLNIVNNKYLGEILSGDEEFKDGFRDILTLLKEHPDMSVKQVLDTLPQNVDTKIVLENYGIDYDRWTQADKDSYIAVQIHSKADETRQNAITSLEAEFNNIAFTNLPAEYTHGIITRLNEQGIVLKDVQETVFDGDGVSVGTRTVKRLYVNDKPIEFSQMKKVMDIIKEEMNKDIWTKQSSDPTVENYRSTMYTHLMKDRRTQIRQAGEIKDDKVSNLEIRQTDMNDINHALFLGNHGSCCTAVGTGCNQFSAPTYIKNKLVSAIEVVDGNNFVGNTMCYFANVDGQPALILDNIELKGQYQFNDKIRDAMFDYAKQLCTEIGQPNLPIYAGPFRHKLNMEHLDKQPHTLQVLGSTGSDEIYLDFITSGRQVNGQRIDNDIMLYKIR